jgi:hypothetical protein
MSCNFTPVQLKTIIVDPSVPVFQKSGITYCDEAFNAFIKYDDMKPQTLEDYVEILIDIERKFIFGVFNINSLTCDPRELKIHLVLGNLKVVKVIRSRYPEYSLDVFKSIFEIFMELLGSYIDLLGEKPNIIRESNDFEKYNRILCDYLSNELSSNVKEERLRLTQKEIQTQPVMFKQNQTPDIKTKRLYGLDGLDIDESVYNQVISWIESRRDFILIDYNNMSEIY